MGDRKKPQIKLVVKIMMCEMKHTLEEINSRSDIENENELEVTAIKTIQNKIQRERRTCCMEQHTSTLWKNSKEPNIQDWNYKWGVVAEKL